MLTYTIWEVGRARKDISTYVLDYVIKCVNGAGLNLIEYDTVLNCVNYGSTVVAADGTMRNYESKSVKLNKDIHFQRGAQGVFSYSSIEPSQSRTISVEMIEGD